MTHDEPQRAVEGGDEGSIGARHLARAVEARLFGQDPAPVTAGRFTIVDGIGRGGMSVVYRARDPELGRVVALKVLSRRLRSQTSTLRREGKALARINHPNVVTVYEVGVEGSQPFIAMEFVEGGSLRDWCERNSRPGPARLSRLQSMFRDAARGLQAAHAAGIVHRDVKPGNILVGGDDRVRIADFGLAKPPEPNAGEGGVGVGKARDTDARTLAGTPAYMAPEQLRGHVDARSDQFSLCLAFAEAMTGRHPFVDGDSDTVANIRAGRIKPLRLPARLRRVLSRGMSPDPARRFHSLTALCDALQPSVARRRVALGLTGAVAVGGALAWGAPPPACEPDVALLGGAWSPEHRARVRQSFVDAGDVGLTAWSTVSHEVDAAVALWTEQNLQACVLARDPEPQTAARGRTGLACSVRAAAVIRDLAPVVETAEPSERLRAEGLRGVVTRLVDCESGVSPQTEASLALASQMDHAVLAATLGRYDRVEALVRGILDAPESESLPSVRASAHTMLSWLARIRDERDEERRHLHDALAAAERGDHPNRIAQIWGDLAILEARSGNPARAEFFLDRARRFVSEGRVSTIRAAGLTMVEGQVLRFAGRHDEALPFFERAVAACREVAPGSALLGWALSNLAEAHASLGKPSKALASNVEAVEVFTRALGGGHPDTAVAEAHLGARYVDAGECDRATPHLDRALASLRADPVVFPEERTKAQRARARCAP